MERGVSRREGISLLSRVGHSDRALPSIVQVGIRAPILVPPRNRDRQAVEVTVRQAVWNRMNFVPLLRFPRSQK